MTNHELNRKMAEVCEMLDIPPTERTPGVLEGEILVRMRTGGPLILWNPAEDITDAWMVVEAMREKGWNFLLTIMAHDADDEDVRAWFWKWSGKMCTKCLHRSSASYGVVGNQGTEPRLICEAAAKAIEHTPAESAADFRKEEHAEPPADGSIPMAGDL